MRSLWYVCLLSRSTNTLSWLNSTTLMKMFTLYAHENNSLPATEQRALGPASRHAAVGFVSMELVARTTAEHQSSPQTKWKGHIFVGVWNHRIPSLRTLRTALQEVPSAVWTHAFEQVKLEWMWSVDPECSHRCFCSGGEEWRVKYRGGWGEERRGVRERSCERVSKGRGGRAGSTPKLTFIFLFLQHR